VVGRLRTRPRGTGPTGADVPGPVELAIRASWTLVGLLAVAVVVMAVFHDDVVGAWADRREGAREAFDQGGRLGLERAGFAPPQFLPVAATMLVVVALVVWVLAVFLRLGYRWGQLGLCALVVGCVYATVALGFVLGPPGVFSVVASLALLVEGIALVCLWHPDTLGHVRGPWSGGPGEHPGSPAGEAGPVERAGGAVDGGTVDDGETPLGTWADAVPGTSSD
jgi:hypothetical protein